MKKIGFFSGSFNPIHIGHIAIANYALSFIDLDELHFVISPQNPLKSPEGIVDFDLRYKMLEIALANYPNLHLRVNDIEKNMPIPSYTTDTLDKFKSLYPDSDLYMLIGTDNIQNMDKWKDAIGISRKCKLMVYPRLGYEVDNRLYEKYNAVKIDAPIIEISSTFIRESIKEGRNIEAFLPNKVFEFIKENNLYRK